ncbi:hypothetical protein K438DRAFT_1832074 [Mycena galopus ATCC 62051]|nr:hypothetical protein K438DRAFT_1832074 [Mycena galopus ATCC 62051]
MGVGNGGLGGCISYRDLDYGSLYTLRPSVLNDFTFRSIHVEAVIGKQIVDAYYGRPHDKAYYLGLVAQEILNQCDGIDGPDACDFRPEALLCLGPNDGNCLSLPQVEALRKIYSPLYDNGQLIYPRYDPGAESIHPGGEMFSGNFPGYPQDWLKYVVLNRIRPQHGRLSEAVNAGGIATFDGDFSAFRDRGGKFLTYHGRADDFYRLFLVPGMEHCLRGPGAWAFGQHGNAPWHGTRNDSAHNLLLALVDWVEGGVAPDTITGTRRTGRRVCIAVLDVREG